MGYSVLTTKGFFTHNNETRFDVTIIGSMFYRANEGYLYIDNQSKCKLINSFPEATGNLIPKNKNIYLANDISVDINSMRKNYNIKRKVEDCDYIIMAPLITEHHRIQASLCYFYPEDNIIVMRSYLTDIEYDAMLREYNLIKHSRIDIGSKIFYLIKDSKNFYKTLLTGQCIKPVISYKDLDLTGGAPLTYDELALTYRLGKEVTTKESFDNYILNIKALNNYNWRNYRGTLGILFNSLVYFGTTHANVLKTIKSQCKTVYDIIKSCSYYDIGFVSEEDFKLGQSFMKNCLEIDSFPIFVSPAALNDRLKANHLDIYDFQRLFGAVTRITLKDYADQQDKS